MLKWQHYTLTAVKKVKSSTTPLTHGREFCYFCAVLRVTSGHII